MDCRNLTDATDHSGGVVATARWQGCAEQLEKPSSPRREIGGAKRSRITAKTGSRWKGERVAAGSVVAVKRSNVRGVKRPCCLCWLQQQGRQGGDDKDAHQFARPEKEPIRQGEGGANLAFLGTIRSRLQEGNASSGLPDGERKQRGPRNRWS